MANPYLNAGIARGIESFSRNKDAEEERVRTLKEHTEDRARMLSEHAEDRAYLMEARGREKEMNEMQMASARQQMEGLNALRAFVSTGDPTAMADVFTKYGGGKVTFRREGDKYIVSGVRPDGTQYGDTPLSADEVGARFVGWLDPKGKIMEDIKYRRELEKEAKKPRNRWTPMADGLTILNQETGQMRPGADPELIARLKRKSDSGAATTAYNALKSGLRDMFAKMDPAGNFFMPEGSDVEYGQALEIADNLYRNGVPLGQATNMAYAAVRGPLKPEEARQKAEQEAATKYGWTERAERKAYIDKRAQELLNESQQALHEYERIMGGQTRTAAPTVGPASGTVVDGYRFRGGNPNDPKNWEPAQ